MSQDNTDIKTVHPVWAAIDEQTREVYGIAAMSHYTKEQAAEALNTTNICVMSHAVATESMHRYEQKRAHRHRQGQLL